MIGKSIQFNRRKALSFLLAVLMLALAAAPALAWYDEGEVNGQAARSCRVISHGQAASTVYCQQIVPHPARPVAQQTLLRPEVARAEQMFIFNQASTELRVQAAPGQ